MIQTESTNKELEALALAEVLEAGTAALARHRTVLLSVLEMLHVFVDGGLFLVPPLRPFACALHLPHIQRSLDFIQTVFYYNPYAGRDSNGKCNAHVYYREEADLQS